MKNFLQFLRDNKVWWITPIVVFLALLVFLAWKASQTPDSPFTYRF